MPADFSTLKIVVCGPSISGKTAICNYLCEENPSTPFKVFEYNGSMNSDAKDMYQQDSNNPFYIPTEGVRIREIEKKVFGPGGRGGQYSLQLWDSSGDHSYEGTWPAIINDANGVILVYNPAKAVQEQEASIWYDTFVKGSGLTDDQCLVILQTSTASSNNNKGNGEMEMLNSGNINSPQQYKVPSKLGRCHILDNAVHINEGGNKAGLNLKKCFDEFVHSLVNNSSSPSFASFAK